MVARAKSRFSRISLIAVIASIYAAMTMVLGEFGYSWLQIRISECLTPLPYILGLPAVLGLTLGTFITNFSSPVGIVDLVFGPICTFIAAWLSWKFNFNKRIVACLYPVFFNAFGVSAYVARFYGVPYGITVFTIGIGEFISAVIIGYPLLRALEKVPLI